MFSSFSSMDFVRRSSISSARSSQSSKSNKSETRGAKKKKSNKPKMLIVDPETGATFEPPKSLVPKKKQVNSSASVQQSMNNSSNPPMSSRTGSFYISGEVSVSDFDDASSGIFNSIPTSASRDESVSSGSTETGSQSLKDSMESRKTSFSRMPKDLASVDRRSSAMLLMLENSMNASDSENEGVVIEGNNQHKTEKSEKQKQKELDEEQDKLRAAMEEERKRQKREEKERKKREQEYKNWLEDDFTITLQETPTMWFIDMYAYAISTEDQEFESVKSENARFAQQQKDKVEKSDNFFEVGVQTLQQFQQNSFSQTEETKIKEIKNKSLVESRSKKVSVSVWEIFDEKKKQEEEEEKEREEAENVPTLQEKATGGDGEGGDEENEEGEEENEENEEAAENENENENNAEITSEHAKNLSTSDTSFMSSDSFRDALRRIERMVVQNQFLEKQIKYKNVGQFMIKELQQENSEENVSAKIEEKASKSPIDEESENEAKKLSEEKELKMVSSPSDTEIEDENSEENRKTSNSEQENAVKPSNSENDSARNSEEDGENSSEYPDKKCKIETLWEFNCSLTQNYSVQNFCFNSANSDILAVGYSELKNKNVDENKSLVCCWTVKNPIYPERIFAIDNSERKTQTSNNSSNSEKTSNSAVGNASIYSMCFSEKNPSLLGVGMSNGKILIYDIRQQGQAPVLVTQKDHSGVWGMQFIDRGSDLGELLHYGLASGSVFSLDVRKQRHDLLLSTQKDHQALTGTANSVASKEGNNNSGNNSGQFFSNLMIASQAPGILCLDFDKKDSNMYLIGTEDGFIHKCSCSYGEHYLESYQGHSGPVYAVKWNHVDDDIFLSCSADWTVKIWDKNQKTPIHSIEGFSSSNMNSNGAQTNAKQLIQSSIIQDVDWLPNSKTIFGSVGVAGSLEIWDLGFSTLKPRAKKSGFGAGVALNKVLFPDNDIGGKMQSVLVGTSKGSVQLLGFEL